MIKKLKAIIMIFLISCFLFGCVKQKDFDDLCSENKELKNKISDLEIENSNYQAQIKDLENQLNQQTTEQSTEATINEEIVEDITEDINNYIPEDIEYRTDVTYDNLSRTPDDYYMEYIEMSGTVIQVIETNEETDLRIATASNGYDDVVLVGYPPQTASERILEDDKVTFKGMYLGITQYESTIGGTISVPMVYVLEIERNQ